MSLSKPSSNRYFKRKKDNLEQRILKAWDMFEEQAPNISTERLFAMVQDYIGDGIDAGDISYALMSRAI